MSFVIYYGNTGGNDIDLFIALNNKRPYGKFFHEELDVTYVGQCWLQMMAHNLDPTITEPLLNGKVIYGIVGNSLNQLMNNANEDASVYLLESAEIFYYWASILSWNNNKHNSFFTLTFSCSYALFALKYWSCHKVITFHDLIQEQEGLCLKQNRIKVKNGKREISNYDLNIAFSESRKLLTDLRIVLGCN